MAQEWTEARAKAVGRLLIAVLVLAGVLVVLGVPLVLGDYRVYGSVVLAIAVVLAVLGWLSLRAARERRPVAHRLSIMTGVATIVLSIPLIPIWIGMITVIAGIGVLVMVVAPERDDA